MTLKYPLLLSYACGGSDGRGQDAVPLCVNNFLMGVVQTHHQTYYSHMTEAMRLIAGLVGKTLSTWTNQEYNSLWHSFYDSLQDCSSNTLPGRSWQSGHPSSRMEMMDRDNPWSKCSLKGRFSDWRL